MRVNNNNKKGIKIKIDRTVFFTLNSRFGTFFQAKRASVFTFFQFHLTVETNTRNIRKISNRSLISYASNRNFHND